MSLANKSKRKYFQLRYEILPQDKSGAICTRFWHFRLPTILQINRFFSPTVKRHPMSLSFGTQCPECVSYLNTL